MSEDPTNEDIFAALAPLQGDFSTADILDAIHAGREERELSLMRTSDPILSRHLDADGRLIAMPRKRANRLVVLRHIVGAIEPDVDHDETAVNNRLRPFDDDVAMLRRYLVDEGLLERRPPGIYRRADTPEMAAE